MPELTSGVGAVDLSGFLSLANPVMASQPMVISQTLERVEVKGNQYTIPPNSTFSVPLNLSPSVNEALFLFLFSAKPLLIDETTANLSTPGPVRKGLQGYAMWTYTPGEGLVALSVSNPDTLESVVLTAVFAATADSAIIPPFWS